MMSCDDWEDAGNSWKYLQYTEATLKQDKNIELIALDVEEIVQQFLDHDGVYKSAKYLH